MLALRQCKLELNCETLFDRDTLDRKQLPRARLPDNEPPVRHLARWVERCDDTLVIFVLVVYVSGKSNLEDDRRTSRVVTLDKLGLDLQRWVGVDEGRNITPGTFRQYVTRNEMRIAENSHLTVIHLQELIALAVFHVHDVIHRFYARILAPLHNLDTSIRLI